MKRLTGVVLSLSVLTLAVVRAASPGPQAAAPPAAAPKAAAPKAAAPKAAGPQAVRPVAPPRTAAPPVASHVPSDAIDTYCVGCHNDVRRGDLSLATFDVSRAAEHPDIAEKIVRKLRAGLMPPKEAARKPDAATRMALVAALETALDAAARHPEPGPARRSSGSIARSTRPRFARSSGSTSTSASYPAGRHHQRQLRQHRRRADAVRDGHAGLSARGGAREPRRGRRSVDRRQLDAVRRAADAVAEGPRRRRAVRHARRHRRHAQLPGRRQIQVPAAAPRRADRASSSDAPSATSRWKSRSTANASRC